MKNRAKRLTAADNDLRLGRRVVRSHDAFGSSIEDTRYPIGFRQDGAVADAQREAQANAQQSAGEDVGLGQNGNGHQVAAKNSGQQ